jgi:tetratricopeptide (TPR) repeat protein
MPRSTFSRPRAPLLWVGVAGAAILVLPLVGMVLLWVSPDCGHDRADREYFAALRGEETGLTREQQIAHLDQAILLAPKRAFFYETRAGYWIDLRDFDRARQDLDRAIELVDRPYSHFMRGLASCQAGEIERSLGDFDTAIARQPSNGQFYRGRSLARSAVGDSTGALADAQRLVAMEPQRGESWYARGVARTRFGRDREAIEDFDRAAAIRPELVYVVEARARALDRLGDQDAARRDFEDAARMREEQAGCAACLDPFRY